LMRAMFKAVEQIYESQNSRHESANSRKAVKQNLPHQNRQRTKQKYENQKPNSNYSGYHLAATHWDLA
jgi:uncharacterized protein YktA (UPF0223 family)